MKWLRKSIFGLFVLIQIIISKSGMAQDVALHKNYIIFPTPNSTIRTKAALDTALTDGKYSTGPHFWYQTTTLGWVKIPRVRITIDLGKSNIISAVIFNTFQNLDSVFNVREPEHIFIFLSKDNIQYWYAGNAECVSENSADPSQIKHCELRSINQDARYIALSVVPNGHFLFCDEISVIKGDSIKESSSNIFDVRFMDQTVDSLISVNFHRNNLLVLNNSLLNKNIKQSCTKSFK